MSLKRKLEKVKNVYKQISLLLNALPYEDSRQIEMEMDSEEVESKIQKSEKQYKQLLIDVETMYTQLDIFHSEMLDRLPVQELLSSQRSHLPALTAVMDMVPENEDNQDIVWVRNWLANPQLNLEEATYFFINACRASAEALAVNCHVLTGQWEHIVLDLIPLFKTFFRLWENHLPLSFLPPKKGEDQIGFVSKRFNEWIIHVVGDPEICPNTIVRFKMLFFFKLLKVDDENYQQAFMSAFSVFSDLDTLDTRVESVADALTTDIHHFLQLYQFTESNHLYQFGLQLAENLKQLKNTRKLIMIDDVSFDYAMGLKIAAEPSEILGLTAILKYISNRIDIHYDAFQESPNNIRHIEKIDETLNILDIIICNFKTTLEEPQLLDISAECVMNITEKGLLSHYKKFQDSIGDPDEELWDTDTITDNISPINLFFIELAVDGEDGDGSPGIVSQEIIRKYKERICRLRTQIPMKFMDVSVPLSLVIYNSRY